MPKARILVTSRPLPSLANTFRQAEVAEIQLDIMQQALNNDVSKYVEHRLLQSDIDETHRQTVKEKICVQVHGSILCARLAMDRFVQDKSADVERLASELPQDVNGLYSSILQFGLKVTKL